MPNITRLRTYEIAMTGELGRNLRKAVGVAVDETDPVSALQEFSRRSEAYAGRGPCDDDDARLGHAVTPSRGDLAAGPAVDVLEEDILPRGRPVLDRPDIGHEVGIRLHIVRRERELDVGVVEHRPQLLFVP